MQFPHYLYGLPLSNGYTVDTDLALMSTEYTTKWKRQRRTYVHNASLVSVSFSLTSYYTNGVVKWLQENDDWFTMLLLSGNDPSNPEDVYATEVRRTSEISCSRVPMLDRFIVSFEVETNSMVGHEAYRAASAGQPAAQYPSDLPLPMATGFASSHDDRNVTTYKMSYKMNTDTLKKFQVFMGYVGTAWFKHPMVSANTNCGYEVIRYTSNINSVLDGPNRWLVEIEAEGYPNGGFLPEFASAEITECSYDYPINYDESLESYDCGGGVEPPPQGSFVIPDGIPVCTASVTGNAPATATATMTLNRDGSVVFSNPASPGWASWHTAPTTLLLPAVTVNSSVEVSTDAGVNWSMNIPGTTYQLKTQDIMFRVSLTSSNDSSKYSMVNLQFDDGTVTYAVSSVSVQLGAVVDILYPGAGFVQNFAWYDYASGTITAAEPNVILNVGVQVQSDGECWAFNSGLPTDPWYNTVISGIGNNLWLLITKTAGNADMSNDGIRISMGTDINLGIVARNVGPGIEYHVDYQGSAQIFDAQVGGSLLASGTISLEADIISDV